DYGQFRSQLSNGCLEKPPVFEPTKPPPPLAMNLTALRLKERIMVTDRRSCLGKCALL
ncbi:MAG: hypothetical protein L6R42_010594, partial [Xanthoria sp. 1 TBL-2021]